MPPLLICVVNDIEKENKKHKVSKETIKSYQAHAQTEENGREMLFLDYLST